MKNSKTVWNRRKGMNYIANIYSIMDCYTPEDMRVDFIDGKGNFFELLKTVDNMSANPFFYSQLANGSEDIKFVRAKWIHYKNETVRRTQLFKERAVQNIDDWNEKFPDEKMVRILLVVDELSTQKDTDKFLKANEYAVLNITDKVEYLAKYSHGIGIYISSTNRTERKEFGYKGLALPEPIELDITIPSTKYTKKSEGFYTSLKAIDFEYSDTDYLSDVDIKEMNDNFERVYGRKDYVVSRDEMIFEMYS